MENALAFSLFLVVIDVEDGVQDLLSALRAVVDTKAHLHLLVWLQRPRGQFLEKVENDVAVLIILHDCLRHHLLLCLFTSLHELKELLKLNVHVIVDGGDHFFNLFTGVDQTKSDQRVLELIDSDGLRSVLVQVFEALAQNRHLVFVKVDVLAFTGLAEPLAQDALRLVLFRKHSAKSTKGKGRGTYN